MKTKETNWVDKANALGVSVVAAALGLRQIGSNSLGPCPSCGREERDRGRGAVGVRPDDRGWRCHTCGVTGDPVALVAYSVVGAKPPKGDARWVTVRKWCRENLRPPKNGTPKPDSVPHRPPIEEVHDLWQSCTQASKDPRVRAWLSKRGLDPKLVAEHDLARVIPRGGSLPDWARKAGAWNERGYRLIVPFCSPEGTIESVQARSIQLRPAKPKAVSPAGFQIRELVATDRTGRGLLRGESEPTRIIIVEGIPDLLVWSIRTVNDDDIGVLAIISGSWCDDFSARIPSSSTVILRVHHDPKGDEYARKIASSLRGRCRVLRSDPPPEANWDENDLLLQDALPDDPEADTSIFQVDQEEIGAGSFVPIRDLLVPTFELLERRARGDEQPLTLPWKNVTNALGGGLLAGELCILNGTSASGKSQIAGHCSLHAAEEGSPVLYVSLELSSLEVTTRLVGLRSKKSWSSLWRGKDLDVVGKVREEQTKALGALPISVLEVPPFRWSYSEIFDVAKRFREKHEDLLVDESGQIRRPFLIVVDYLQLIGSPEHAGREDARERIQRAAYALHESAKKLGAVVLAISSVARPYYKDLVVESREDLPDPASLIGTGKESGEIEYGAPVVLVLARQRPSEQGLASRIPTTSYLAVAKSRTAPTSWQKLKFDGSRFSEPAHAKRGGKKLHTEVSDDDEATPRKYRAARQ